MLKINGSRLWASLMAMAEIGATARGGSCRLALSDEDKAGRELFAHWCREASMTLSVDAIGNLFARRAGTDPDAAPVMMGSHLDTQPGDAVRRGLCSGSATGRGHAGLRSAVDCQWRRA